MTASPTATSEMDHLDQLGAKAFDGYLVRKDLVRTGGEELFKARSRDQGSVKIIDLGRGTQPRHQGRPDRRQAGAR